MENEIVEELTKNIKLNLLKKLRDYETKNADNWQENLIDFIINELADVKSQLLKTKLDLNQVEGINLLKSIKYDPRPGIENFKIFDKNESIDICSEALSFNLRPPLKAAAGKMVRWSGPGNIFGFIARINREKNLNIKIPILKKGSSKVMVDLIEIDGVTANHKEENNIISFAMPKRTKNILGDITTLTLKTNTVALVGKDELGLCLKYIILE
ncbi:hypothetical protein N9P07_05540 [Alphaproteobacteria bacterium]|nr:hypothetical protein [Alphaproteobacteria bacterium]